MYFLRISIYIYIYICKNLINWILRTFRTRDSITMMTLWKSLILPKIEYCSPLLSNISLGDLQKLEGLQRSFTYRIDNLTHDYWARLKTLKLFSIERRFERYLILYIWKVIEEKVSSPSESPIALTNLQSRTGRKCTISRLPITSCHIQNLFHQSPIEKGKRLFNSLPKSIRNITGTTIDGFKHPLNKFLASIPDEPGLPGYSQARPALTNSIIDQIRFQMVVPQVQPASVQH